MPHAWWVFVCISAAVIATPGPDTVLTVRNTLAGGRRGGLATALGVVAGQLVWATATALGLVAVLLGSAALFHAVKLAGAAYLVVLGVRAIVAALRDAPHGAAPRPNTRAPGARRAAVQGLLSNLGNPKMALFFAGVFPQFAPREHALAAMLAMGALFASMTALWLAGYAWAVARAARATRDRPVWRAVEAASGLVLAGLGAWLAFERE